MDLFYIKKRNGLKIVEKQKILLDTDIGCDYDDCLALTYLLQLEDVELLGITTCTGYPHRRAMLAEILCNAQGRKIPVCTGAENPIIIPVVQYGIVQTENDVIDSYPHENYENKNDAVEFMRNIIEENPYEVTLACIGPLTNAALLFATYPHTAALLKGIVIMGGRFGDCDSYWGDIEWNIRCDYHAADIVFRQEIPNFTVAGVEVTSRYWQESEKLVKAFGKEKKHRPVAEALPKENQKVWFHDVVALMAYLEPAAAVSERGEISVDLNDREHMGATRFTPDKDGHHELIRDYDIDVFFEKYCKTVGIDLS